MTFRLHGFYVSPQWLHHHLFPRANKQSRATALRILTDCVCPKTPHSVSCVFSAPSFYQRTPLRRQVDDPNGLSHGKTLRVDETARPMDISGHVTARIRHANPSSRQRGNKTPHISPFHPGLSPSSRPPLVDQRSDPRHCGPSTERFLPPAPSQNRHSDRYWRVFFFFFLFFFFWAALVLSVELFSSVKQSRKRRQGGLDCLLCVCIRPRADFDRHHVQVVGSFVQIRMQMTS